LRPSPSASPFRWFLLVDMPLLTFYAVVQRFAVIVYSASSSPLCCRNQTRPCWLASSPNNMRATSSNCPATHHHYRTTSVEVVQRQPRLAYCVLTFLQSYCKYVWRWPLAWQTQSRLTLSHAVTRATQKHIKIFCLWCG
jgi:hypothetical protein